MKRLLLCLALAPALAQTPTVTYTTTIPKALVDSINAELAQGCAANCPTVETLIKDAIRERLASYIERFESTEEAAIRLRLEAEKAALNEARRGRIAVTEERKR